MVSNTRPIQGALIIVCMYVCSGGHGDGLEASQRVGQYIHSNGYLGGEGRLQDCVLVSVVYWCLLQCVCVCLCVCVCVCVCARARVGMCMFTPWALNLERQQWLLMKLFCHQSYRKSHCQRPHVCVCVSVHVCSVCVCPSNLQALQDASRCVGSFPHPVHQTHRWHREQCKHHYY